jgi:hypothetical protein
MMSKILIYLHGSSKVLGFVFESTRSAEDALSRFDSDISNAPEGELIYIGDDRGTVGLLKRDFHYFEMPRSDDEDDQSDDEDDGYDDKLDSAQSPSPKKKSMAVPHQPKEELSLREVEGALTAIVMNQRTKN